MAFDPFSLLAGASGLTGGSTVQNPSSGIGTLTLSSPFILGDNNGIADATKAAGMNTATDTIDRTIQALYPILVLIAAIVIGSKLIGK